VSQSGLLDSLSDSAHVEYRAGDTNHEGHGIHAVGFIDNDDLVALISSAPQGEGGGCLIIENSWSSCWGDGRYICVPHQSVKDYTPDATVLYGIQ
jgi:C1A family cysteine protease